MFKTGDKVRIRKSSRYDNEYEGFTGVITGGPYKEKNKPRRKDVQYTVSIKDVELAGSTTHLGFYGQDLQKIDEKEEKDMAMFKTYENVMDWAKAKMTLTPDSITNVIFNPPATIVFWKDGTKTIVKCGPNDIYDEEAGLAMAISKKMFGNDGTFHKVFKKWLPEPDATDVEMLADFKWLLSKLPDPKETVHTDGRKFYSMSDILREGMMSLYFKEHGEELCLDDKEKE